MLKTYHARFSYISLTEMTGKNVKNSSNFKNNYFMKQILWYKMSRNQGRPLTTKSQTKKIPGLKKKDTMMLYKLFLSTES